MTRQAKYSRALLYLVIIVGAIPLMSPFFWLVSSSLKTYNRVYHYPPEWLPVTEDFFVIEKNAPSLMVNLIDKNEDTQTGVYRIRIIGQGENDFLVLPDSMIKVHTRKITLATVDNQQHEIEIIARSPAEKAVRAKVKNKFSQITLPTERVMSRTKTKSAIRLYRQNVIVEVVEKNESKAKVRIAGVSEPFDIALSRLNVNSTDSALAEITGKNLLAQVIRRNELAGIASVRLMPSATLLEVESPSIFETRFTEYFIDLDNRQIPVKWVTRGSK
ncbi:hypothetical protein JXJ21_06235, partial [candidate division KSB1 bacterium]|nr:hypothetical protein [candidate division KSB1 bacterium]